MGEGAWSMTVLSKRPGRVIYEGEAPDFGDRGEANNDLIASLWWAERMIDEHNPPES